ncbi:hypothetical protein EVG20_g8720 [Dentipellis fragilis]|uniref:Uncharacterized protein n=1 Tax=Dentipellis fragilis TaxID=205917 RepID=A0A4Y9Y3P1_9AGAM|nr:hypothetical protein EVG20_g8720 [Dentipellis fragilis]
MRPGDVHLIQSLQVHRAVSEPALALLDLDAVLALLAFARQFAAASVDDIFVLIHLGSQLGMIPHLMHPIDCSIDRREKVAKKSRSSDNIGFSDMRVESESYIFLLRLGDIHLIHILVRRAIREPALALRDLDVVPAHLALAHQPVGVERPVLYIPHMPCQSHLIIACFTRRELGKGGTLTEPVAAVPRLIRLVVKLIPELHRDLVIREREQLLPQPINPHPSVPYSQRKWGFGELGERRTCTASRAATSS